MICKNVTTILLIESVL